MNLPLNTGYVPAPTGNNTPSPTQKPVSQIYTNLAEMRRVGGSPFSASTVQPTGTPAYYNNLKNFLVTQYGQNNVPTEAQFMPPSVSGTAEDQHTPIPVPSDYSGFVPTGSAPGSSYSWQTPVQPEIMNIAGDVPGQYVKDASNPDA